MFSNLGIFDRLLRSILGLVLYALIAFDVLSGPLAIGAAILGAIFILTSAVAVCPLYLPFGLSTKKKT